MQSCSSYKLQLFKVCIVYIYVCTCYCFTLLLFNIFFFILYTWLCNVYSYFNNMKYQLVINLLGYFCFVQATIMLAICNNCKMGITDLPDMYAQSLRAAGPRAEGSSYIYTSRLTVVSREAKKQQVRTLQDHRATTVSNLHARQL